MFEFLRLFKNKIKVCIFQNIYLYNIIKQKAIVTFRTCCERNVTKCLLYFYNFCQKNLVKKRSKMKQLPPGVGLKKTNTPNVPFYKVSINYFL